MSDRIKANIQTMTETDVTQLCHEINQIETRCDERRAQVEAEIDKLKIQFDADLANDLARKNEIADKIHTWLNANKHKFVKPQSKIIKLGGIPIAKIGFRKGKGTITLLKDDDKFIALLRDGKFDNLIITVEKPDRKAIRNRVGKGEYIPGTSRMSGVIEPFIEPIKTPSLD